MISRPDLADRAICVSLPYIPEHRRRSENELWRSFESAKPQILGSLLDAMAHGLRTLPQVRLAELPRMADFALWSTACEAAFCHAGGFLHGVNRRSAVEDVVEADPLAAHIRNILAEHSQWRGTASDLLRGGGNGLLPSGADWPKSPRALAGRLRRVRPPLRALGIEIDFSREGHAGARMITLRAPKPKNVVC